MGLCCYVQSVPPVLLPPGLLESAMEEAGFKLEDQQLQEAGPSTAAASAEEDAMDLDGGDQAHDGDGAAMDT